MLRRPALVGLAIALVVPLAACSETTRLPDAEPSSEVAPLFASDEEALAAATAAYEEYLAALDTALQMGEVGDRSFSDVAEGAALLDAEETLSDFVERGVRITGQRVLTASSLQQYSATSDRAEVQLYVCESVAGVDVIEAGGGSIVEPDRPDLTAFEALVVIDTERSVVHDRLVWPGGGVCDG